MAVPRRVREQRGLYARVPDPGSFRINAPAGFLHDYAPIAVPTDSVDADGIGGAWWRADGDEPYSRTTGSPLTERANSARRQAQTDSILPSITRCTTILTEAVVRTRWLYHSAGGDVLPRPLWVHDPMLLGRAPGPIFPIMPAGFRLDGHSFYSTLLANAILFGRGAFIYIEGSGGSPVAGTLILLNPLAIHIDQAGYITLDRWGPNPVRTDFDGRFSLRGQTWRVAILHGMYPNIDGWPQGVLLRHFSTFKVGARVGRYLGDMFETGVPSGYLSVSAPNFGMTPVDDPDNPGSDISESELLKREWMRAHGRSKRSVAVLNSTVAYTPIALNPVDSDAINLMSNVRRDIAHAFGMSSIWLDEGTGGLDYSNSSERRADLVNLTAAGWGEKMVMLISSLMPYGTQCAINWPTFVQPSMETLMPAVVQAVQAGIMTGVEARQQLGVEPWTGPDPNYHDNTPASKESPVLVANDATTEEETSDDISASDAV